MFLGAASDNHKSMTGDSGTGMVHPALDSSHQVQIQHEYYSKTFYGLFNPIGAEGHNAQWAH